MVFSVHVLRVKSTAAKFPTQSFPLLYFRIRLSQQSALRCNMNARENPDRVVADVDPITPPPTYHKGHYRREGLDQNPCTEEEEGSEDGWFLHHYTDKKKAYIYFKLSYAKPVEYPLPPQQATLDEAPDLDTKLSQAKTMTVTEAMQTKCDYSILHSPTFGKAERQIQAQKLKKLRDERTVAKRAQNYTALFWTWKKRSVCF